MLTVTLEFKNEDLGLSARIKCTSDEIVDIIITNSTAPSLAAISVFTPNTFKERVLFPFMAAANIPEWPDACERFSALINTLRRSDKSVTRSEVEAFRDLIDAVKHTIKAHHQKILPWND
jgi:hypothetical protein